MSITRGSIYSISQPKVIVFGNPNNQTVGIEIEIEGVHSLTLTVNSQEWLDTFLCDLQKAYSVYQGRAANAEPSDNYVCGRPEEWIDERELVEICATPEETVAVAEATTAPAELTIRYERARRHGWILHRYITTERGAYLEMALHRRGRTYGAIIR